MLKEGYDPRFVYGAINAVRNVLEDKVPGLNDYVDNQGINTVDE